jgi:hypothetical protein
MQIRVWVDAPSHDLIVEIDPEDVEGLKGQRLADYLDEVAREEQDQMMTRGWEIVTE